MEQLGSAVRFDNLKVTKNNGYILNVSTSLNGGCVWQIVGGNGSGKTSLLYQILYGQEGHSASVTYAGYPASRLASGALSYSFLYPKWTVEDNLKYFIGVNSKGVSSLPYACQLIPADWLKRKTFQLSEAENKIISITILLEAGGGLLVLDELDSCFDDENLQKVINVLHSWVNAKSPRIAIVAVKNKIQTIENTLFLVKDYTAKNTFFGAVH